MALDDLFDMVEETVAAITDGQEWVLMVDRHGNDSWHLARGNIFDCASVVMQGLQPVLSGGKRHTLGQDPGAGEYVDGVCSTCMLGSAK